MVLFGIGTIVSPCPPKTKESTSLIGTCSSCDKKRLKREVSKTPAIPITLFFGSPEYFCKAITITSRGLVMQITKAFGEVFLIPSATCLIIFKFIPKRSSRVIPVFLGTPAVIITTSEFFVSS